MSRRPLLPLGLLGLLLFVAADAASAANKTAPYQEQKNVIYGEVDGIALVMNVFKPAGKSNGIAIIDVASGAWHSDKSKIEDHRRAQFYDIFTTKGYTVFAIRPGSITKFSALEMIRNLRVGIQWVRDHAKDYGIDPDKMGISGASAGAHLASLLVVSAESNAEGKSDLPIQAVGLFFPPTDFTAWGGIPIDYSKNDRMGAMVRGLGFSRTEAAEPIDKAKLDARILKISPAKLVKGKLPPFLIFHGDADLMVPLQQSEVLVEALKKSGTSVEFTVKKGGAHPWPTINEEVQVMGDWFDKQLLPKP